VEFGFGANRARVERPGFGDLGDTNGKLMSLDKASSINMAKTLMPKVALMVAGELFYNARGGG
jgi:hypothetical protein